MKSTDYDGKIIVSVGNLNFCQFYNVKLFFILRSISFSLQNRNMKSISLSSFALISKLLVHQQGFVFTELLKFKDFTYPICLIQLDHAYTKLSPAAGLLLFVCVRENNGKRFHVTLVLSKF